MQQESGGGSIAIAIGLGELLIGAGVVLLIVLVVWLAFKLGGRAN